MAKISQPHKDSEPSQVQKDDDKINITISRRALKRIVRRMVKRITKFAIHSGAQIAISISVYSLLPSMPLAHPKPTQSQPAQSQLAQPSRPIGH
ncbi:MAG: hypothetical protein ACOYN8_15815 [Pseudanabaena sp.]|jgi:hypothetical protein